jgi:hypothetical protein
MFRNIIQKADTCRKCLAAGCRLQKSRDFHVGGALYRKLSDFQLRKITQEFDHMYDSNGDGYIDKRDVEGFKRKIRTYVNEARGHAAMSSYSPAYEDYWTLALEALDSDRDGKVQRESWIALWENLLEKADGEVAIASLPQWIQMMPGGLFPAIDFRGNGKIDPDEYREFWHKVGGYAFIDDERLNHIYQVLTESGKYTLDLNRVQELYADFYLSDDRNSPGRYIAGPMDFEYSN